MMALFAVTGDILFSDDKIEKVEVSKSIDDIMEENKPCGKIFINKEENATANFGDKYKYGELHKYYNQWQELLKHLIFIKEKNEENRISIVNCLEDKFCDKLYAHQKKLVVDLMKQIKNRSGLNLKDENLAFQFITELIAWDTGVGKSLPVIHISSALVNTQFTKFSKAGFRKYPVILFFCPKNMIDPWFIKFKRWNIKYKTLTRVLKYTTFASFKKAFEKKRTGIILLVTNNKMQDLVVPCNTKIKNKGRIGKQKLEMDYFHQKIFPIVRMCVFDEIHMPMNNDKQKDVILRIRTVIEESSVLPTKQVLFMGLTATPMRNKNTFGNIFEMLSKDESSRFSKIFKKMMKYVNGKEDNSSNMTEIITACLQLKKMLSGKISTQHLVLGTKLYCMDIEFKAVEGHNIEDLPQYPSVKTKTGVYWGCIHPKAKGAYEDKDTSECESIVDESPKLSFIRDLAVQCKKSSSNLPIGELPERIIISCESVEILKAVKFFLINLKKEKSGNDAEKDEFIFDEKELLEYRSDSSLKPSQKKKNLTDFQEITPISSDPSKLKFAILLLSTTSGAVGLDIFSARYIVNLTPHWDHTWICQTNGRCFRTGQTRDVISYTLFVGPERAVFLTSQRKDFLGRYLMWEKEYSLEDEYPIREEIDEPTNDPIFNILKETIKDKVESISTYGSGLLRLFKEFGAIASVFEHAATLDDNSALDGIEIRERFDDDVREEILEEEDNGYQNGEYKRRKVASKEEQPAEEQPAREEEEAFVSETPKTSDFE